jgi:hypothetical protein
LPSWKKVLVSGSDASLNSLNVATNVVAQSFTGSLFGTASFAVSASQAQNATTASYVLNAVSASFATSASFVTASNVFGPFGSNSVISASFATFAETASYATNGGVTQILAGPNITVSPLSGRGQVTISSTGTGSGNFNTSTGSYGSFYDTTTQINPVANAANSMSFNETDISNGVSISGSTNPFNTYIKTENAGVYDIQFSAQLDKTDTGKDEIVIWLRKNGTDLTDTATSVSLTNNNDKVVAAWNWFVQSAANDYYQIIWSSADIDMRLLAEVSSSQHPGIPSVILTANRVDQFLSNTGSFNGTFTGQFTGSLFGTASFAISSSQAQTANTASYVLNAVSASFATSASQAQTATNVVGAANRILFNSATNTTTTSNNLTWEDSINLMTLGSATGTAGTISKIALYTSSFGGYGLGVSPAQLDYVSDGSHVFYKNGVTPTELVRIANNGDVNITGSLTVANGITGSLHGTASWAQNTITASYAVTASHANFALSSSQATSASFAATASFSNTSISASFATNALTASYALFAANGGGGGGGGATVTHTQLTASTTWSFGHNLNTLTPLLQVYDLNYEQIIPNEIVSINAFASEIRFDYTQAGYAVASSGGGLTVTGSTPRLVQTVAATTWSFAHNLGTQFPGFEVFDQNDYVVIPAGIYAIDENNAEIYFATPSTGVAIANFSGIDGVIPVATSASYAATASLALTAISSSYTATASYSDAFGVGQTLTRYATVTSSINGSNTVFTQATGSYTSAFFKYTVASGSNSRSGEIMSVWNGTTAAFTDNSTTDIGTTTDVTSSVAISGTNVQLNMQTNSSGWRIKSIATFM